MNTVLELKCKKLPNNGKFEINKIYNGIECCYNSEPGELILKIRDNCGVYINFLYGDWKKYFNIVDIF